MIKGVVTKYRGEGRKLGYPTANITSHTRLRDGIYFGRADLGGYENHPSLVFVGIPVTLGEVERRIEAHLLDLPDEDYYGKSLVLTELHFHRPNTKFDSVTGLIDAMREDERIARDWFNKCLQE